MANIQNPTTAQLLDWLEGRLAPTELPLLTAAIQTDPTLQEQVAWLRDFLQISRTTTLTNPPADARQANRAIFTAYAQAKRPPNIWQTLIATLTADNWQRPSLSGVRDVSLHTTPRQLIYTTAVVDVALNVHIQIGGQQIDLDGQLFPLDDSEPDDFVIQLLQNDVELRLTVSDGVGKFTLTGLAAGIYDLILSSDRAEIQIGAIDLT